MPYGRILYDTAVFLSPDGDRMSGVKGEVVDMSDADLERLSAFDPPAVEKATKKDFDEAATPADEPSADGGPPGLTGEHVRRAASEKSSAKSEADKPANA